VPRYLVTVSASVWRERVRLAPAERDPFVEAALTHALAAVRVGVRAADGRPLAPCHPARARELLRAGRATLVSRSPPVIELRGSDAEAPRPPVGGPHR